MPDIQADFKIVIDGRELPDEEKRLISTVEYEESLESGHASSLAFTIQYPDHAKISPTDFRVESNVEFYLGTIGDLRPMFVGVIVDIRPKLPSDSAPRLEIECDDLSYRMKRAGGPEVIVTGRTWEDVARKIVSGYGLKFKRPSNESHNLLLTSLTDDQSIVYGGWRRETNKYDSPSGVFTVSNDEPGDTPWMALGHIADRLGYRIFVRGDAVFIVGDDYMFPEQPNNFTLVYNPAKEDLDDENIFPIIELDLQTDLAGNNNSVRAIAYSPTHAGAGSDGENAGFFPEISSARPGQHASLNPQMDEMLRRYDRIRERQAGYAVTATKINIGVAELFKGLRDASVAVTQWAYSKPDYIEGLVDVLVSGDPLGMDTWQKRQLKGFAITHQKFLEGEGPIALSVEEPEVVITNENLTTQQQADQAAKAHQERIYDHLTRGSGRMAGDRRIRAGHRHLLKINGLGEIGRDYSGEYRITKAVHSVTESDGYMTSFEVSRRYARTPSAKGDIRS